MGYWQDRQTQAQTKLTNKNQKEIDKQLVKYYQSATEKVIKSFISILDKVQLQIAQGKQVTPALFYQLDGYWEMQAQLRKELQKLGEKQITLLSEYFEIEYFDIYNSISLASGNEFSTISKEGVKQMLSQIWCADGKNFSQRIWSNTDYLVDTLNEELLHCVTTGKKTSYLKTVLQERFNVSYNAASTIVRTELAHIQTEAAQQRYKDYGVTQVQIWADPDERTCEICGKLHKKIYPAGAKVPIPAHPNCRCCIVPVVNLSKQNENKNLVFLQELDNKEQLNK